MFTPVSEIHNYDTRQAINKNLLVSFKSTSRGQQSITYIGPHVWNFILSKINPHCSIGSFKRHIRQLLQHCSVSDLTWWSLTLQPWWRHQMETFSTLLALCAGGSPVPVISPRRGQWRGALMFSLICAGIKDWVNNHEAGDLRRHRGHYDVNVMNKDVLLTLTSMCLYIYIYAYGSICFIYIYMHMYMCYFLFN